MILVLLVDDEQSILEISKIYLKKAGDFEIDTALSAESAIKQLETRHYDVVVADYEMPGMNGLDLLNHIRSQENELGFILFTGRGREEVAIHALNGGADFYLQKGYQPAAQYAELRNMILKAASHRQHLKTIRENEEKFSTFFNLSSDAIIILDEDRISDLNKAALALFSLPYDELVGRRIADFSHHESEEDSWNLQNLISSAEPGSEENSFSWIMKAGDGAIRYTLVSAVTVMVRESVLLHVIIHDITEQKHEEERMALNQIRLETMLSLYRMRDESIRIIMNFALDHAVKITQSQYGYLAFVKENETIIEMYAWSENAMTDCRVHDKPIFYSVDKTGLWGETIRQRRPIITNDYNKGSLLNKGTPKGHIPLSRHMNIPIFYQGEIVLIAGVANKRDPYLEDDVTQLTLLINGLWEILIRKKTEDELIRKKEELEAAYEELRVQEIEMKRTLNQKNLQN